MYLVRYSEIGLKGRWVRREMERLLCKNIEKQTGAKVEKVGPRILVKGGDEERLKKVFGIHSFSPVIERRADINDIKDGIDEIIKKEHFETFAIRARRITKDFPFTSMMLNRMLGDYVREKGKMVDLEHPDLTIGIEIIGKKAYIFTKTIKGPGGIPIGGGRVIALISRGIDSPVAAWFMMRRGCMISALSFGNRPKSIDMLSLYSPVPIPSLVEEHPMKKLIEEVKSRGWERWTCLICKRAMLKKGEELCMEAGFKGIVTGENLGQVASQTLENIYAISYGIKVPIFRPLIGWDKEEIVKKAKEIGTYEYSDFSFKCPYLPKRTVTKAHFDTFLEIMEALSLI